MRRLFLIATLALAPLSAKADTPENPAQNPAHSATITAITTDHILPRFDALATTTQALSHTALQDCTATSPDLRAAFATAFDAWIAASHLRFGPTELNDRAFALAFWPDSRGTTPRTLAALIADQDPIASDAKTYHDVSIAARGFYALELMLYDDALTVTGDPTYRCKLVQTISIDIAATALAILDDWQNHYAGVMQSPGPDAPYRSDEEVLQELLRALEAGLQFTADSRLGRPLGTFDRPRPLRAEARRSARSARHVALSLAALNDLAAQLAAPDAALTAKLSDQFADAQAKLTQLNDPVFAGVSDPNTRLKIEILQQAIESIHTTVQTELGPLLGVAAGFNALDGD